MYAKEECKSSSSIKNAAPSVLASNQSAQASVSVPSV